MARKPSKFLKQQKLAVAVVGVIIVASIAYLASILVVEAPLGDYVEGEHYQLIENPRRLRSDKIEVMEFFSYGCIHCFNFDPDLNRWVAQQQNIRFVRTPAIANDYWRHLGRAYYVIHELGISEEAHTQLFSQIHRLRKPLDTKDAMIDFLVENGADENAALAAWDSAEIKAELTRADQMARRLEVASVPTIIVHGKYLVKTKANIGPSRLLDIIEYLVQKESTEMDRVNLETDGASSES